MTNKTPTETFAELLAKRNTADLTEAISALHDESGIFKFDEGPLHDYKQEYPFSSSDNYFAGILRLICAFHNSYGGVLIFGVHDKNRKGGHNKVHVDSEKINRKLRETLSRPIEIQTQEIETPSGPVQALMVPARKAMVPPIYTAKPIGNQPAGKIFIRKGAEVIEARGSDLNFLYGNRLNELLEGTSEDRAIPASLPPSPATIREFVGRFRTIERIIEWIRNSRDPRLFLWGQGGSGKSTIAYEAAVLISELGAEIINRNGRALDRVLYISGKALYLDPYSGKINEFSGRDFSDGLDIFKAILQLSEWTDPEVIDKYSREDALDALDQLFDIENQLIVIDDIDTLTTSNVDAGMEELFLTLSRSRSGTKILYTLRGFPSYAPNAAHEIPGLDGDEFDQFVKLCSENFSVPAPIESEKNWISEQSEGRPLAIETIIGMRRITSSYEEAFKRWKENSTEAREYLFNREYQQLGRDDRARHLLAALSVFETPQSFNALQSVLQFSPEQLQDAIAETRDMFLRVSPGKAGDGDLYSIGAATKLFVSEVSKQLDMYSKIEAKVQHFKMQLGSTPAAYVPIIERARRALQSGNAQDAVSLLTKKDFPPTFREHPDVQALLGQAYACLKPPKVIEARECFESAFSLGHRHYRMYIDWLELEKRNRTEIVNGIEICKKVVEGKGFDGRARATFLGRLARLQALRAKDLEMTEPNSASQLRADSALNNLLSFSIMSELGEGYPLSQRERVDASISIALRSALRDDDFDSFFDTVESLLNCGLPLDDFSATISERILELQTRRPRNWKPIIARLNRLSGSLRSNGQSSFSKASLDRFLASVNSMLKSARASAGERSSL